MRYFTITATVLFALVAMSPLDVIARPPGGGGGWGGYSRGYSPGYSHGYYHGYPGHWYGYGSTYNSYVPETPYVVERPIVENPVYSGLPAKIVNPATNGVTLSYVLNGVTYSIPPGSSQDLVLDRSWVIRFSRGGNFGEARYGLEPGVYTFTQTDHGWELYHTAAQTSVVPTPSNGVPANPTPNPTPAPGPIR